MAQEFKGFDPRQNCMKVLSNATTGDQMMIAAWVFGYIAHKQNTIRPVHLENNKVVLGNVARACRNAPHKTMLELIGSSEKKTGPGSEDDARALLKRFVQPGADRVALTARLKPRPEDIQAVFEPGAAARLIPYYDRLYTPGAQIGPKSGQTDVLVTWTTTDMLRQGKPILKDFPGGYEVVRNHLKGRHPIVRFKFVRPGEKLGLAFDGLIFVNNRWVLLPKAYRALQ